MIAFESDLYKTDDESHDVCPTCGARVRTTTPPGRPAYRKTCPHCSWSVDLDTAPDSGRLVTDGGTTATEPADGGPQSAQDILDELYHDDSVAAVADAIAGGDERPSPTDCLRTLALAEDQLCLVFDHDCGVEYVWLADGWQHFDARLHRTEDGATIDVQLRPTDLEHRLDALVDVALVGSTPVSRPDGGAE